jgi:hypothetical protein
MNSGHGRWRYLVRSSSLRCGALLTTAVAFFASGPSGCQADEPDTRPASFGTSCTSSSECQAGFSCLATPNGQQCTARCSADSECPSWHEVGHCAGDKKSTCTQGVCETILCK